MLTGFVACTNNKPVDDNQTNSSLGQEPFAAYKILKREPYETAGKAQVKCYAYLTTDTITKDRLSATLTRIYDDLKSYNNFKKFSSPTVIAIYLFTSKERAENMTDLWIGMLSKSPSNDKPDISFDELKIRALQSLADKIKSDDTKKYEFLTEYLKKRNTDLSSIFKLLYDIETTTAKQADIKFPNDMGTTEYTDYKTKLYKEEKSKLFKKYNIDDSLSGSIDTYGLYFCR